jgi:hypothetical protein
VREVPREVEEEPEANEERVQTVDIDAIDAIEVDATSVCSSSPSPTNSVVMQSDQFCSFTVLSLMEFHDSEFDLSLKGGLLAAGRFTGQFDYDDSEVDPDSGREDIGGIGEGEDDDRDNEDICDVDLPELDDADEDDGMEFHDSNVGLDFALQALNLQDYQGLDELEGSDEDYDDEIVEEIYTDVVLGRFRVGSALAEVRAERLARVRHHELGQGAELRPGGQAGGEALELLAGHHQIHGRAAGVHQVELRPGGHPRPERDSHLALADSGDHAAGVQVALPRLQGCCYPGHLRRRRGARQRGWDGAGCAAGRYSDHQPVRDGGSASALRHGRAVPSARRDHAGCAHRGGLAALAAPCRQDSARS